MVTYPISIPRERYFGSNQRLREKAAIHNRDATQLEQYVNALLLKQVKPVQIYIWEEIASGTGLANDIVARLGYAIDCGHRGFTGYKQGMTHAMAMAVLDQNSH